MHIAWGVNVTYTNALSLWSLSKYKINMLGNRDIYNPIQYINYLRKVSFSFL